MFFVYFLTTKNKDKGNVSSYIGWTNDLTKRLNKHNSGKGAKFTRGKKWKMIYHEIYTTKLEATRREYYLKKNRKLRNYIKKYYDFL